LAFQTRPDSGKLRRLNILRRFIRSRYPAALGAGLVLAAAFPTIGIAGLAWIAPALMLLAAIGKTPGQAFRIGYAAGLAHYLASLYWLLLIPVAWAPILGWLALGAFLALYPATWVWACWKLFPARLADATPANIYGFAEKYRSVPWSFRVSWAVTGAAVWVTLEMLISRFLSGFPWNLLGASQYRMLPLIQIASWTGIYGVSFIVVWFSLSLLGAGMALLAKPAARATWVADMILPMAAVGAIYLAGYHKLLRPEQERPMLTVALVQPSIPQTLIWDPAGDDQRFQQLVKLSGEALAAEPDLVVWPEAAIPKMVRYDEATLYAVTNLAVSHKVWMVIGSDDAQPRLNAKSPDDTDYFNASFLVSPWGELVNRYIKRRLVVFGEYVPLEHWLPFLKYLTPIEGGFTPGKDPMPFQLTSPPARISVLICFEDVFPQVARKSVFADTDFLLNLTNDGWFRNGAAQWQHAASAVFRAVENGVPLVRCANNGVTCWIDGCGRIERVLEDKAHDVHSPGFLLARIPLLLPGEKRIPTYYHEYGDRFGWACTVLAVAQLAFVLARERRPRA
jgi:apolipoprotein N-acyltransferase